MWWQIGLLRRYWGLCWSPSIEGVVTELLAGPLGGFNSGWWLGVKAAATMHGGAETRRWSLVGLLRDNRGWWVALY